MAFDSLPCLLPRDASNKYKINFLILFYKFSLVLEYIKKVKYYFIIILISKNGI